MIKFFDVLNQDKLFHKKLIKDISILLNRNDFILGKKVFEFEKKFAKFCNTKYAISCANGTDALTISLKILNLPKDSEVIIPAMTYCSTAFSVINANLKPILVDLKYNEPVADLNQIIKKISKKTKVIIPVHLYGSAFDIKKLKNHIKKKRIYIIDDCSQAHGCKDDRMLKIGSLADISCFSLYPGKNLGAYGDAGIITTKNKNFYEKIRNFRNLGSTKKFEHTQIGFNSRLDTIQALVLLYKLKYLIKNNIKRTNIAKIYDKKIINPKITKLKYSKFAVYHQYVVVSKFRKKITDIFKKNNIQYGFHYPKTINQLSSLKGLFKKQKFINSEIIAKYGLSLPIDPNLRLKDQIKIIKILNSI